MFWAHINRLCHSGSPLLLFTFFPCNFLPIDLSLYSASLMPNAIKTQKWIGRGLALWQSVLSGCWISLECKVLFGTLFMGGFLTDMIDSPTKYAIALELQFCTCSVHHWESNLSSWYVCLCKQYRNNISQHTTWEKQQIYLVDRLPTCLP